ncbi:MAG: beta-N-acetylhexosaminidase [Devosiaceae bacterium]|nr:beta-N-acetylhexosaminidase [Devosiaceae bacterium MH13]
MSQTISRVPGRSLHDLPKFGTRAFICGLAGLQMSSFERDFLGSMRPWGVILFARNVDSPGQVRDLTASIRDTLGWHAPVLVDQEGGRVQRLKPPHWRRYPSAGRLGSMEAASPGAGVEAAQIATWMIADDLLEVGIDVNCAPVLDLRVAGATNAIGNRAYHGDPEVVATMASAVHDAYLEAGVVPVIKHLLGHGRAREDSHELLPRITADRDTLNVTDFAPFKALRNAPMGMTGHLVFDAVDATVPVTLSRAAVDLVRKEIGFQGALLTDDLSMGALSGSVAERASQALEAGCDLVLHCNGTRAEMEALDGVIPELVGRSAERCAIALARRGRQTVDRALMNDRLETLLAQHDVGDDLGMLDPTRVTHV